MVCEKKKYTKLQLFKIKIYQNVQSVGISNTYEYKNKNDVEAAKKLSGTKL